MALEFSPSMIKKWVDALDAGELRSMGWTAESLLQEALSKTLTGLDDGKGNLIGAIISQQVDENTREILFLATVPAARGQGRMKHLLRTFVATQGPGSGVWLECREDNAPAIALYTKIGFKESGRRPKYYKDGTTAILFNF